MKLTLTKLETRAIEGARLLSARLQRDIDANTSQIRALVDANRELKAQADGQARGIFDAIADDAGTMIPDVNAVTWERKRDGTSTIEWPTTVLSPLPPAEVVTPAMTPTPPLPPAEVIAPTNGVTAPELAAV